MPASDARTSTRVSALHFGTHLLLALRREVARIELNTQDRSAGRGTRRRSGPVRMPAGQTRRLRSSSTARSPSWSPHSASISPTAVRALAASGYGLPYPDPPELSGAFSGASVCTQPRRDEKLIMFQGHPTASSLSPQATSASLMTSMSATRPSFTRSLGEDLERDRLERRVTRVTVVIAALRERASEHRPGLGAPPDTCDKPNSRRFTSSAACRSPSRSRSRICLRCGSAQSA
jgi:hypothetical protein